MSSNLATSTLSHLRVDGVLGRDGGQLVSVLAFYSSDPSSNLAEAYNFSVKFVIEKNENKQKEAGVTHFF